MKNIIQTAEQLLGRKLTANDGYTSDEIKQAENMLGLTMPESLTFFYSLVGKLDVLTSSFQRFYHWTNYNLMVTRLYFLQTR